MASVEALQRRARWGYEKARIRLALLGIAPFLVVVGLAVALTQRPLSALGFGLASALLGALLLWYGRDPQRGVLPGLSAGVIPLVASLYANNVHGCASGHCSTLCVPACVAGGVVAGLVVAWVGHRRRAGLGFWLSASSLAVLTGAMGCACVGYSGVVGLVAGFAAGVVPQLVRQALTQKPS